ncbi:hypothetical protein FXO37_06868 [Capsicum annuum]|nr:hypothetical protein FXO37_06868 [Capsicum annuum]
METGHATRCTTIMVPYSFVSLATNATRKDRIGRLDFDKWENGPLCNALILWRSTEIDDCYFFLLHDALRVQLIGTGLMFCFFALAKSVSESSPGVETDPDIVQALNSEKLPVTVGLYSFYYGSHSVFPNIYSSMKEPSRFPSILLISFSIAFFSYLGVAVCGFLMFGENTNPQFTMNLPAKLVTSKVAA